MRPRKFYVLAFCILLAPRALAQSDDLLAGSALDVVEHALIGRMDTAIAQNSLSKKALSTEEILAVLRQRLDPALVENLEAKVGTRLNFYSDKQKATERFTMIALIYPDDETAEAKAKLLPALQGVFHGVPKTVFSYARSINQLTIVYTDVLNDTALTKFVKDSPKLFGSKP